MPEREIIRATMEEVKDWIYDAVDGDHVSNLFPGGDNGVYVVGGEPLVIDGRSIDPTPEELYTETERFKLICSDNHARELTKAGIVDFNGSNGVVSEKV